MKQPLHQAPRCRIFLLPFRSKRAPTVQRGAGARPHRHDACAPLRSNGRSPPAGRLPSHAPFRAVALPVGARAVDLGAVCRCIPLARAEPPMAEALTLYLAAPRGFCAGVDRAIKIVEMALEKWGAPVYVRHEIVHNRFVVDELRAKGAVFVEELAECPPDRPVVFSAHGVPKSVPAEAERRQMLYVDATCPLVSKVHIEAERHHANGLQMVMIGHAGHPEVIGTMGQLPRGRGAARRDGRRRRRHRAARPRAAGLHHPDHALGRRHRRDRRGAAAPASRRSPGRAARTSATPRPTARRRSRRWRRRSTRCW